LCALLVYAWVVQPIENERVAARSSGGVEKVPCLVGRLVALPSRSAREAILCRNLEDAGLDLDPRPIAAAARGASGADLREPVSVAVPTRNRGAEVTTDMLARVTRTRFESSEVGQYL
jgi:hypothetical protein